MIPFSDRSALSHSLGRSLHTGTDFSTETPPTTVSISSALTHSLFHSQRPRRVFSSEHLLLFSISSVSSLSTSSSTVEHSSSNTLHSSEYRYARWSLISTFCFLPGVHQLLLSVVSDRDLLQVYSLFTHVKSPHITSSYHIQLDSTNKDATVKVRVSYGCWSSISPFQKVSFTNPFNLPHSLRLVSSNPSLLCPLSPIIDLPPLATLQAPIQFYPVQGPARTVSVSIPYDHT